MIKVKIFSRSCLAEIDKGFVAFTDCVLRSSLLPGFEFFGISLARVRQLPPLRVEIARHYSFVLLRGHRRLEFLPGCVRLVPENAFHAAAGLELLGLALERYGLGRLFHEVRRAFDPVREVFLLVIKVLHHVSRHALLNARISEFLGIRPSVVERVLLFYGGSEKVKLTEEVLFVASLGHLHARKGPRIKHFGLHNWGLHKVTVLAAGPSPRLFVLAFHFQLLLAA